MRKYLLTNSKVMIVIGGAIKTKEEVLLAQERNLTVMPVGMSEGTAFNIWRHYQKNMKYNDENLFMKLNNTNPIVASNAVIQILKDLIAND